MLGDATLFTRSDEVEASWTLLKPILDHWKANGPPEALPNYEAGTWGPKRADARHRVRGPLLAADLRRVRMAVEAALANLLSDTVLWKAQSIHVSAIRA